MGSWPLIYKKNFVCPQVLLNSLNVRTFAAAIKILLCCETFWTDLFAKLSTAAPTQLGKKNKTRELYCLVNFTSRDWLSRFKFFKGLLFIGGRERRGVEEGRSSPSSSPESSRFPVWQPPSYWKTKRPRGRGCILAPAGTKKIRISYLAWQVNCDGWNNV